MPSDSFSFRLAIVEKQGVTYKPSDKPKSDIYRELLPLVNSGRAELLDNKKLRAQLEGLERRTARGGKDSIDHGPGAHDDIANSVAGVLVLVSERKKLPKVPIVSPGEISGPSYWRGAGGGHVGPGLRSAFQQSWPTRPP